MSGLLDMLADWPMARAQEFMEARRKQALPICIPGQSANQFYPFHNHEYAHAGLIKGQNWDEVRKQEPQQLIPVNPFEPSQIRKHGLRLWDAVAGIPSSAHRPDQIVATRMLTPTRNTNEFWQQQMLPALGRVGRLTPDGDFLRPKGPWIFDMMLDPLGWKMVEGAHALAHRVAEMKPRETKKKMLYAGGTHFHMQRFLAQMCVCRAYGLPLDVLCLDEGKPGTPDVAQYGIEIKSSSYFRTPVLKLPAMNREAPRPDETLAVVTTGVFIEPHPHGFTNDTQTWKEINRWACTPSVVIVAGWELMDVISHQPFCATDPLDKGEPVCYGMSPSEMQSPESFWAYLRYAYENRGAPAVDNKRYWLVEDWLNSDDYAAAVGCSPPLPCWNCLRMNMHADGAPRRPIGKPPLIWEQLREDRTDSCGRPPKSIPWPYRRPKSQPELEWDEWEDNLVKVWTIIDKATAYYEGRVHGHLNAAHMRTLRRSQYRRRVEALRRVHVITEKIDKAVKDSEPSKAAALRRERDELLATLP